MPRLAGSFCSVLLCALALGAALQTVCANDPSNPATLRSDGIGAVYTLQASDAGMFWVTFELHSFFQQHQQQPQTQAHASDSDSSATDPSIPPLTCAFTDLRNGGSPSPSPAAVSIFASFDSPVTNSSYVLASTDGSGVLVVSGAQLLGQYSLAMLVQWPQEGGGGAQPPPTGAFSMGCALWAPMQLLVGSPEGQWQNWLLNASDSNMAQFAAKVPAPSAPAQDCGVVFNLLDDVDAPRGGRRDGQEQQQEEDEMRLFVGMQPNPSPQNYLWTSGSTFRVPLNDPGVALPATFYIAAQSASKASDDDGCSRFQLRVDVQCTTQNNAGGEEQAAAAVAAARVALE